MRSRKPLRVVGRTGVRGVGQTGGPATGDERHEFREFQGELRGSFDARLEKSPRLTLDLPALRAKGLRAHSPGVGASSSRTTLGLCVCGCVCVCVCYSSPVFRD